MTKSKEELAREQAKIVTDEIGIPNTPEGIAHRLGYEHGFIAGYDARQSEVDELQELKEQNKKLLEEINLLKSDVCSESKWADQYKQERDEALKLVYELESRFENADSFARAYANEFGSMRGEIEYLKKQNKKMIEALELIAGPVEFYCEVGERNKQACAQAVLEEIKK